MGSCIDTAMGWAKIGASAIGAGLFASTGLVDYVLFAATAPTG